MVTPPVPETAPAAQKGSRGVIAQARVLIVDNSRASRSRLERFMRWAGAAEISLAANGFEGLQCLDRVRPDIVLLEAQMPGMDGYEMCRRIRSDSRWDDIPVIFQTRLMGESDRVACFEAGAADIIVAPLTYGECAARVRLHLERRRHLRELKGFRRRIEADLIAARGMQMALLPSDSKIKEIESSCGLRLRILFDTCDELGGDFWTIFPLSEGRVSILCIDFSGHGIAAAVNTFRLHMLVDQLSPDILSPSEFLVRVNRSLHDILPIGQFAAAFYAIIDPARRFISYSSAGHPAPVLDLPSAGIFLDASGCPLGVIPDAVFTDHVHRLDDGWGLLIYSDALNESRDSMGRLLEETGVREFLRQARRDRPLAPVERFLELIHAGGHRPVLSDDLTMIWVEQAV